MQAIVDQEGNRKRAYCLCCLAERRPWIGGELCKHFDDAVPVEGSATKLERPIYRKNQS